MEKFIIKSFNSSLGQKKAISELMIQMKVGLFAWEAYREKVLTLDKLQRQGWSIVNQ